MRALPRRKRPCWRSCRPAKAFALYGLVYKDKPQGRAPSSTRSAIPFAHRSGRGRPRRHRVGRLRRAGDLHDRWQRHRARALCGPLTDGDKYRDCPPLLRRALPAAKILMFRVWQTMFWTDAPDAAQRRQSSCLAKQVARAAEAAASAFGAFLKAPETNGGSCKRRFRADGFHKPEHRQAPQHPRQTRHRPIAGPARRSIFACDFRV